MKTIKHWWPSPMEQKCLRQLDRPGSWAFLNEAKPDETDSISWKPLRRIFAFNLIVFAVAFVGLGAIFTSASGAGATEVREDLPTALEFAVIVSCGMALYATNIYRNAWNRRARSLHRGQEESRRPASMP